MNNQGLSSKSIGVLTQCGCLPLLNAVANASFIGHFCNFHWLIFNIECGSSQSGLDRWKLGPITPFVCKTVLHSLGSPDVRCLVCFMFVSLPSAFCFLSRSTCSVECRQTLLRKETIYHLLIHKPLPRWKRCSSTALERLKKTQRLGSTNDLRHIT